MMPAHMRPMGGVCSGYPWEKCGRPVTHRVFNSRNARMGDYCKRCATERVKSLRLIEEELEEKHGG